MYKVAAHILCKTPRRTLPYPKIFLKRPKHLKPSTYHIRKWCEYRKRKTLAIRELAKKIKEYQILNDDGDIQVENWRAVKEAYHINGLSMWALIRHASAFLAQHSRKNEKKGEIDERESLLYQHFLDRKKRTTFGGVARLNRVETVDKQFKFGRWDSHASRAVLRVDRLGCPFALFDFRGFPGAWNEPAAGSSSTSPFLEPSRLTARPPYSS